MRYFLLVLCVFARLTLVGQVDPTDSIPKAVEVEKINNTINGGVPVGADSTLLIFNGMGPFSIEKRIERITKNLEELRLSTLDLSLLKSTSHEIANDILCGDLFIMSVSDEDAKSLGLSRRGASDYYIEQIKVYIENENKIGVSIQSLLINIGIALVIVALFVIGLKYFNRIFRLFYIKIQAQSGKLLNGFSIKNYELLTKEKQVMLAVYFAKILKILILVIIIYLLLPILFSLFPWTQPIATKLFGYILTPVKSLGVKFLNYIPSLLTITVIWFITKYVLKLLLFFQEEVAKGRLTISGFYPEWAKPTYNIVKIMVIALAFIGVWPLLPMSDSDIFKGVSTFIGLLVALGGSGAISNVIAGVLITYMRSFEIGDRVKIGDVIGDVKEKSLLNTRVKTIKNEIITIPNSQMLSSHTINYTDANDEHGLILYTTVTIGYDVPWRKVHELLIDAALKTEFIKKLPKPYVLQTSLDDFYVSYQLNARTREVQKMAVIYSEMHKNIQDVFNEAGVEIMSPHYGAHRDGNQSTIPQENLPPEYQAPWFRIKKE